MASNAAVEEDELPVENGMSKEETFDTIQISEDKLKYIQKKFTKVNAKMYDYKCDVKVSVGDANFKAHRHVLSDASEYFSAMFSTNMKEKDQDVIEIQEISPAGFTSMLEYFYHGYITMSPEHIQDILESARFFHSDWLIEVTRDYLVHHLSLENYENVVHLADAYSLGDLHLDIYYFFGINIGTLSEQPKFYENLSMELLSEILNEDYYIEAAERFLLDVVLNWVHEKSEFRQVYLLPLLRLIRFGLMDSEELETLPAELDKFPEIMNNIEEAKSYALLVHVQCLHTEDRFLPRGSRTCFTFFTPTDERLVVVYKEAANKGFCMEELMYGGLDTEFEHTNQAVIGNFLFAAGGYSRKYCSSDRMFRYDPRFREWTELASMSEPRVSFAMCSSDTKLFAIGGVNHIVLEGDIEMDNILSSVEMYDPDDNSWVPLTPLVHGSYGQAACVVQDAIWLCGGISDEPLESIPLRSTFTFSLSDQTWVIKSSMITGRQGHNMTHLNGKLYVFGGITLVDKEFEPCLSNEVYDMDLEQWTAIVETPTSLGQIHQIAASYDNKIYLLGGKYANVYLMEYDSETDTLEEKDVVGPACHRMAMLKVPYPRQLK